VTGYVALLSWCNLNCYALQGFSDPESIAKVVEKMRAAGASIELFMYDGSGHAFMNALTEKGRAKIKGGQSSAQGSRVCFVRLHRLCAQACAPCFCLKFVVNK
jgi:hypothetical protein